MTYRKIINNALSIVGDGELNNTTSPVTFSVVDGSVFPESDFWVTVWDYFLPDPLYDDNSEILLCTSRTGNNLTCLRGKQDTNNIEHEGTPRIGLMLTAGNIEELHEQYDTVVAGRWSTSIHSVQNKNSILFKGDGYISVPDSNSLDANGLVIDITCYIKTESVTEYITVLAKQSSQTGTGEPQYCIDLENGKLRFFGFDSSSPKGVVISSGADLRDGLWHKIRCYFDGVDNWVTYVDDIEVDNETDIASLDNTSESLFIGTRSTDTRFFEGNLDLLEIKIGSNTSYWNFNGGSSTVARDITSGNNGVITNATFVADPYIEE
jgi:hypothetical protein